MNSQEGPTSNFSLSKSICLNNKQYCFERFKVANKPCFKLEQSIKGRFCKIKVILPQRMNLKIWDLLNNKERRIDI